jgi:hypothetical protein
MPCGFNYHQIGANAVGFANAGQIISLLEFVARPQGARLRQSSGHPSF